MSKRYVVLRSVAAMVFAVVTASILVVSPVRAAEATPAPGAQVTNPQAQPATAAPGAKPAATPKAAKPPKSPKPPKPPEKSLEEQRADDGLWARHTNWLPLRAGYAKATGDFAGDGLVGYGMAFQRMLSTRWSFGGSVQHDLVGHLGNAYEISVPFAVELTRHFKWHTAMRPYVGIGTGYYFHKYYRTAGENTGSPGRGTYFNLGTNVPIDQRHLLGVDTRVSFVQTTAGVVNPVFGTQKASETLWSIKLNWAFAY